MKKIISLVCCALCAMYISAQGVDEVTLVVSGEAPTKEEAIHLALRSAIEQAFGCFVSANTDILNDELIKDEIVTVTSGNIKSYDEINVTQLESSNISVTLRATVSVNKLISYAQSHGSSCELNGALLSQEARMLKMNIENTKKALEHLYILINEYVKKNALWEYSLDITKIQMNGYVEGTVTGTWNDNGRNLQNMIKDYLAAISINGSMVKHLADLGFKVCNIDGYATYADVSCVNKDLKASIGCFMRRRHSFLIVDNLGFVYPSEPLFWPKPFNTPSDMGTVVDPRYDTYEQSTWQKIALQIPDTSLSRVSKIELIPRNDSRFSTLFNQIIPQAMSYLEDRQYKLTHNEEDKYYFCCKMLLYLHANAWSIPPDLNLPEEDKTQLRKHFSSIKSLLNDPNISCSWRCDWWTHEKLIDYILDRVDGKHNYTTLYLCPPSWDIEYFRNRQSY